MRARARGQEVYAETCPHYLTLSADEAMPRFGARAKIAPPLRTRADMAELWRGRPGPARRCRGQRPQRLRRGREAVAYGNVLEVGFGAPGVESLLSVIVESGVNAGRVSLERLVEVVAEAPARIFRLPRKGAILPGKDADLVIFDPTVVRTLSDDDLHGNAYYSLYSGLTVHGAPLWLSSGARA
jgi:dihydroorotase-like cyclic amidohydrolase